jgi:radical SAM superfamily enzyme YgiQ (UPF0313 family)
MRRKDERQLFRIYCLVANRSDIQVTSSISTTKTWAESNANGAGFSDVYEVGMSHGKQILYGLVNETTGHLLERSYAPWPDMESLLRQNRLPLYSLESFKPLGDFDVVGFSLQYELSITNCINMLDMAQIPVCSKDRAENDPFVIAGGPVAFNPEPFADFFDAFLIGDGEEVLPEYLDLCFATRDLPRSERLLAMAKIPGVYIPAFYRAEYMENGTFKELVPWPAPAAFERGDHDFEGLFPAPNCPL